MLSEYLVSRFIEGKHSHQSTLFPDLLDDYITQNNPARVTEAFVEALDLFDSGFQRTQPKLTVPGAHAMSGQM